MSEPRADYTADEIMTPELMAMIRVKLRITLAHGYGDVIIRIENHKIKRVGCGPFFDDYNGGNTKPLE